jgi:hypothetical protein
LDPRKSASHESDGSASAEAPQVQRRNRGRPPRGETFGAVPEEPSICQICRRSAQGGEQGRSRRTCASCGRIKARCVQEGMTIQVCCAVTCRVWIVWYWSIGWSRVSGVLCPVPAPLDTTLLWQCHDSQVLFVAMQHRSYQASYVHKFAHFILPTALAMHPCLVKYWDLSAK